MTRIRIAVCSLNQLALDFVGNCDRIIRSIQTAIDGKCHMRTGPELEIPGYSCEDAFFELDTVIHSWEILTRIISMNFGHILIDLGMPVMKDSTLYNCRVILLNSKILLIRPKTKLAGNGNYREERWFTPWNPDMSCWYILPPDVQMITGQRRVPFSSNAIISLEPDSRLASSSELDPFRIGFEICEELWRPDAIHIKIFGERGAHLICNSSASYWEVRKLDRAFDLMTTATMKSGGAYAFSNLIGCDGSRLCFYGRSLICTNGKLVTRTSLNHELLDQVQVAIGIIDTRQIDSYRQQYNIKIPADKSIGPVLYFDPYIKGYDVVTHDILDTSKPLTLCVQNFLSNDSNESRITAVTCELNRSIMTHPIPEEEILNYASLWLWDYLRKSGLKGFILPLSGGIDSSSVACLVYAMSHHLFNHIKSSDNSITDGILKILNMSTKDELNNCITGPKDICSRILRCVYLPSKFSGTASRSRAANLSKLLGAEFMIESIGDSYDVISKLGNTDTNTGDTKIGIKEQNLQARLRMVYTYHLAEGRLVLSSGNVDEALVGYLTKYDCSSGDLNPIGSISKNDLRSFMSYFRRAIFNDDQESIVIQEIITAEPSAELTGEDQLDEDDLGLTYDELSFFGSFRRGTHGCYGPYLMFCQLWNERFKYPKINPDDPKGLSEKIKRFYRLHAINRHKQTVLTPALHAESYSPDDNRFDHRQFLFDVNWRFQFQKIDQKVQEILIPDPK